MKPITSLHVSQNHVRVLSLSSQNNRLSVHGCQTVPLTQTPSSPDPSELHLEQYITHTTGTAVITLGGGHFHMQRVPLEVASEADRKAQIEWEASQVLIDSIDHYTINFMPAGRVAFWTAIRTEITQIYAALLTDLGIETVHFLPEPIALHCLCAKTHAANNQGAIWLGHNWGSFVAQNNQALTIAETVHFQQPPNNESRILSQIKQWIQGDLNTERRRPAFEQVLLCGENDALTRLSEPLSDIKMPQIIPFDMQNTLQHTSPGDLPSQDYALALGAALMEMG